MSFGRYRNGKLLLLSFVFVLIFCTYLYKRHESPRKTSYNVLVWWSPYEKHLDYHRKCGQIECRFTSDRKAKTDPFFSGYLFYGAKILNHDMPAKRRIDECWGLYHDASPKSVPFLLHGLDLFNLSSTFSRHSTVPLTLQPFTSLEKLVDYRNMYTFGQKTGFQRIMNLAPILYLQSHCDTLTGRELYVKELSKYIAIDSYGKCLRNKTFPTGIINDSKNKTAMRDFYDFVAKYKFIIVYQDMICEDYITDKFWKSLTLGIVPIYFGATNIRSYLPNPDSAILIDDYSSPLNLAQFLLQVSNNEDLYAGFLYHKISSFYPISNQLLVNAIFKEDIYYIADRKRRTIVEFECSVCEQSFKQQKLQAQQKELSCKLPYFPAGNVTHKALTRVDAFIQRSRTEAVAVRKMTNGW